MNIEHRIERIPESGCWIWMDTLTGHGYGNVKIAKRYYGAHRAVFLHFGGDIPEGMELDHLCGVRSCVNPYHLEAVTHRENILRSRAARKTHCNHGHEFTNENTEIVMQRGNPVRRCKICQRAAMVRYYWRKKRLPGAMELA